MKRTLILLGIFAGLLCLVSCKKEETRATEGIYLKTLDTDMIYIENEGPCRMENLSEEQKQMLAEHKTGDVISVEIDLIQESYPAHCYPKSVKFVREEEMTDALREEAVHLRAMGYYVITEDHPDGLPAFEFSLTWGVYGISSYDSASGKLIKTTDATHPEDYVTTHLLTSEERQKIWTYLMNMNYTSYPEEYDPFAPLSSKPNQTIVLRVTAEGEEHVTACRHIALGEISDAKTNEGGAFVTGIYGIADLLRETEEWKALPEYEFLYE